MPAQASVYIKFNEQRLLARSLVEARWAATLDSCSIDFQYEPEYKYKPLHPMTGKVFEYLPDFYLPEEKTYLEVKWVSSWRDVPKSFPQYDKYQTSFTDPFCLWQQLNSDTFKDAVERLSTDPKYNDHPPRYIRDEERLPYVDVWLLGGKSPAEATAGVYSYAKPNCPCGYSCHSVNDIEQFNFAPQEVGICPNCKRLGLFNNAHLFSNPSLLDGTIRIDCQHCGLVEVFNNLGQLEQQVFSQFRKAAKHSESSARVIPARKISETIYEYERDGRTCSIMVPPGRHSKRRG